MAFVVAGVAVAAGAAATSYEANKAASSQKKAASQANKTQNEMFNVLQENLNPYKETGNSANQLLNDQLPSLTQPVVMNQKALAKTPGYQFELGQGLKSVQNAAAARGLGASGAALKGASQFATGLASSNYQQQFNNAVTNQNNTYNRLLGVTTLGEDAAAGVGAGAMETGKIVGQNTIGAGDAQAAAYNKQGQAYNNMFNTFGGLYGSKTGQF